MNDITPIRVGIIGGAGYTGGETLRLLLNHPYVTITCVQSRSQAGKPVSSVHSDLVGETNLLFTSDYIDSDVYILCLGHGDSRQLLQSELAGFTGKIIDLGNDFRVDNRSNTREFIYGLPELNRDVIRSANSIANPGCFATAITLALLPMAHLASLGDVFVTGITGSTGAGQKLQESTHFSWRNQNISAYKTLTHQHLGEIQQSLRSLMPGFGNQVHFIPWRGDFTRGIFVSAMFNSNLPIAELQHQYQQFYRDAVFTHVAPGPIDMKQVVNTNKCLLAIEKSGDQVVVHATIDNLLKGAAGQAIQNLNLMSGFPEATGLKLKPAAF